MDIDFNEPISWFNAKIHEPPSGVDVEAYQEKINAICGLNPFGKPNILLTWCPSMDNYSRVYCSWDKAGFGIKIYLRGQYVYETVWDDENNPIDIPPPRWALKQFLHPSQYLQADDKVRWKTVPFGKHGTVTKEMRPPRPADGIYIPLPGGAIGKHNHFCCLKAKEAGEFCWGDYREPGDAHLLRLEKAVAIRDRENETNPNEPISLRAMQAATVEASAIIQHQRERSEGFVSSFVDENLNELLAHFTGDDLFLEKTKDFSFASKSGLILPKEYVTNN